MKTTIYIYDNERAHTGVYVSENFTRSYSGGDCEEIEVEIPESFKPKKTDFGTTLEMDGYKFMLDECLGIDREDHPYIKTMPEGKPIRLKVTARNGRRSRAYTI